MKFFKKLLLSAGLFGGGLILGSVIVVGANSQMVSNQPGSVNDPLVTKSYVDAKIAEIAEKGLPQQTGKGSGTSAGSEASLEVVKVKKGQTLYAGAGTEMIVRTGKTVAVSDSANGIPDVTAGKDIKSGESIENNHLLIFPAEGRGIRPHESTKGTVVVMVRGNYLLLNDQ